MPIDIVVDAMGSDKAPEPEIRGAILAARQFDVRVHLVGPEDILRPVLRSHLRGQKLPVFIVPASEWITMDDKAAQAVRTKRDSSMRVGLKMVREGRAAGFFTAGNTGAAMATAKMVLGMLAGVDRPALATILPTVNGWPSLLLDVGANVDCEPENLVQFAIMGHMYARNVLKIDNPRVGLLSIGEEDSKGNSLTRDTFPLLRELAHQLHRQRRRPRPLQRPLPTSPSATASSATSPSRSVEGAAQPRHRPCCASPSSPPSPPRSAPCSRRKAFNEFKKRLDYSEYGGAPLLGVRGVCIVGHGSSNDRAIMNGIRVAAEFAQAEVNSGIEAAMKAV